MDRGLLVAAKSGDTRSMELMASTDPGVLLGTTPQGNTCLHISAIHGHVAFCKAVAALNQSLLAAFNADGETPLLVAVTSGHVPLASVLLRCCRDQLQQQQREAALSKQDNHGCNALHHAIRSGHRGLALELIAAEPSLSRHVNKFNESPMFMAVMRGFTDVSEKLLEIPDSAHSGGFGYNALHAAVRNENSVIVRKMMETRPGLAREESMKKSTPLHLAIVDNKISMLRVLLEFDWSLGYVISTAGDPLLITAAIRGHVGVAQELLRHCPDAPYRDASGGTYLHVAIREGRAEFVEFVLGNPCLRKLVNMQDNQGDTALHVAIKKNNPRMVSALLLHSDIDVRVLNSSGTLTSWASRDSEDLAKTLNWNEVSMLMLQADPQHATSIYNLQKMVKDNVTNASRKDVRTLTQTYTSNTSLVAILMATITFAAAFTLPGGYSNDAGNEGLPIMTRNLAFKAFLISDTLAMCSSLAVAFVCVVARWEDLEFLRYYRSFTRKLMWFAYMATTTAFATGLYTVLAPRLLWLAITICALPVLLPFLTKILGEWPVLKIRFRLGRSFKSDLLDVV